MFEINMLVAIVVMLNILKLIMELLPNYSASYVYVLVSLILSIRMIICTHVHYFPSQTTH